MAATAEISFLNRDALPVCLPTENSHRLVSLWEIVNRVQITRLVSVMHSLLNMEHGFQIASRPITSSSTPISFEDASDLLVALNAGVTICKELELVNSAKKLAASRDYLFSSGEAIVAASAQVEVRNIRESIIQDLEKQAFLRVPETLARFLNEDAIFGAEVWEAFPAARADISYAGNCLATECDTAAVFHLMRCAEWGLRGLAAQLRVKITHKGKVCPIEYGDWDAVITAIKNKIIAVRKLSNGPKRQSKLEYYSDAADHCTFMKDIWRNNISHTRKPYIGTEAKAVFERVRDFMQFLARTLARGKL